MDTYEYTTQNYMQNEYQPAAQAPALVSARSVPLLSERPMTLSRQHNTDVSIASPNAMQTMEAYDRIPPFLKNNIGRWARIDFLIGNGIEQRIGQIVEVGSNYLVLRAMEPETVVMCDLFSIKFATVITDDDVSRLFTI